MKIAIVHDWLVTYGGAERVLAQMLKCFPQADLFAVVDGMQAQDRSFLNGKTVNTTLLQHLPSVSKHYRKLLPLMPWAMGRLNLSQYDVVISSSHAVAKGVHLQPHQLHICLCYSPMRYAWDLQESYLKEANLHTGLQGLAARWVLKKLQQWDFRSAQKVHHFIAISNYIAQRIERCYGRQSVVIYPPVDVSGFQLKTKSSEQFYLTASRLVPYKNVALMVAAFNGMPDRQFKVIGDGPEFKTIQAMAGPNVEVLGHVPFDVLKDHLQRAKAFVFAADEDFGIAPLEAQACGTPVIAFGKGGALETVKAGSTPTGHLFAEQTAASLKQAVLDFEKMSFKPENCRENALQFSEAIFRDNFSHAVMTAIQAFKQASPQSHLPAAVSP
jgi:glycosyltransferase involved in cell wall biosynthesis